MINPRKFLSSGGGGGGGMSSASATAGTSIAELARWVPVRLSSEERALLTVLEQALRVSEYTDHVDVASRRSGSGVKTRRILDGILEACHISTGLAMTTDLNPTSVGGPSSLGASAASASASRRSASGLSKKEQRMLKKQERREKKLRNQQQKEKNGKLKKKNKKKHRVDDDVDNDDVRDGTNGGSRGRGASGGDGASWAGRDPADNAAFFQTIFEIGRRNKVLNPSSMRTTYGKLMYLLQDAQNPVVAKSLGFSLHKDMLLVRPYLQHSGCLDLLHDPRLECAVQYISDRDPATGQRLDRAHVEAMVQGKRRVTDALVSKYGYRMHVSETDSADDDGRGGGGGGGEGHPTSRLSPDEVRRVIESLADAVAYIESNVRPVQSVLRYLEENFDPDMARPGFSLALRGSGGGGSGGMGGSYYSRYGLSAYGGLGSSDGPKLSHSHSTQYTFVSQSLQLWCKVMRHMHRLWVCADDDLLSTTSAYHLYNTGQGLNRVQNCPKVRKVMTSLLHQTQQETSGVWVGLSVIHLGDRDVPNALIFIDKYTQIPRFLNPIVSFLQSLEDYDDVGGGGGGGHGVVGDSPGTPDAVRDSIRSYIKDQFGSKENLKLTVLADYFKHGFDGSGDDGGSCIDGRLTSSWNWTSKLAKKSYYHAFMLISGFQGFDGDFR